MCRKYEIEIRSNLEKELNSLPLKKELEKEDKILNKEIDHIKRKSTGRFLKSLYSSDLEQLKNKLKKVEDTLKKHNMEELIFSLTLDENNIGFFDNLLESRKILRDKLEELKLIILGNL